MLSINNLSFHFGSRALYDEASLHIKPKDRLGLIGANGTGKSTLLRLIVGEYTPDGGSISKANDCSIGFLNQDLLSYQTDDSIRNVAMQAFAEALDIQRKMDEVIHKLETDYEESLVDKLAKLQEDFERLDGYTVESRTDEVLEGLGFNTADLARPLREFSGGWRMRVMLAKLLLENPSLLLLDEPTNHLDLPSIQWIEEYLRDYEGAIVVVSHDREFLNRLCNGIVEVSNGALTPYTGNYDAYLQEREERRTIQAAAYENQQNEIRQTERFIERFRAKASKSTQVQSRVKALNRLDRVDEVMDENAKVNFKFTFSQASGRQVVSLKDISKAYGTNQILSHTTGLIERGQKIALVGANGKGKTTLLRIIAGEEAMDGERETGHNVREAFFAQHQLEALNTENTILEEMKQCGSGKTEQQLRTILGCFLFTDEDAFKKIKVLSGGEKSRVALAKTLVSEANFLLLDEPTNHLDIQSVNILIQAIQQYQGTCVVVSHDRHFVSQIANTIWYIENKELKTYLGTWEEYLYWVDKNRPHSSHEVSAKDAKPMASPEVKKPAKEIVAAPLPVTMPGKLSYKEEQEVAKIEARIEELETRKKLMLEQMATPEYYEDMDKARKGKSALAILDVELEGITKTWEALVERIA